MVNVLYSLTVILSVIMSYEGLLETWQASYKAPFCPNITVNVNMAMGAMFIKQFQEAA